MALVGKIKLESLIAGQPSPSRGNRSDHINDKQAFRRLWHLSPSDCDKHSSVWQTIHSSGTSVFVVQSDRAEAKRAARSQQDALVAQGRPLRQEKIFDPSPSAKSA